MQKGIKRTVSGCSGNTAGGVLPQEYRPGGEPCQTNPEKTGAPGHDFLGSIFCGFPVTEFEPLYSEENYMYLYYSAENYARLLGKELGITYQPGDFSGLYNALDSILPEYQELEMIDEDNDLFFKVIDCREDHQLHYIPCSIIDRSTGIFRTIMISFFRLLIRSQGLGVLNGKMIKGIFSYEIQRAGLDQDGENLLARYLEGDISKTFELLDKRSAFSIKRLIRLIETYTPLNSKEEKILTVVKEGLDLFKLKKKITKYADYYDEDEYYFDSSSIMDISRSICVFYENDLFGESTKMWILDEDEATAFEFLSGGSGIISPETDKLMRVDPYVQNFINWLNKLENELQNI